LSLLKFLDENILKLRWFEKAQKKENIPEDIKELVEQRFQAKKEKNFKLADELREKIHSKNYNILDTKQGYKIEKIK